MPEWFNFDSAIIGYLVGCVTSFLIHGMNSGVRLK